MRTGSPKRGAAVWSGTSTRRRRTSGWARRSRGSPPAEPTGRECAPWMGVHDAATSSRCVVAAIARRGPPLAAAGVAGPCRRCARLPPHGPHAAVGEQIVHGITAAALERHLRHLRRSYQLVPASQLHCAMLARRRGRPIPIAVTFDDDLASHLEVAAPLLRRLACPATFFLTGAGLDGAHGFAGGSACRRRRTGASTYALRFARSHCALAPGSRSPASPSRSSGRPRLIRAAVADALAAHRRGLARVPADAVAGARLARAGFEIGFHTRDHRPRELADDELARALDGGQAALGEPRGTGCACSPIPTEPLTGASPRQPAAPATPTALAGQTGRSRREPIGCCSAGPSCCSRPRRIRAGPGLRPMGGSLASRARRRPAARARAYGGPTARSVAPTERRASGRLRWRSAVTA